MQISHHHNLLLFSKCQVSSSSFDRNDMIYKAFQLNSKRTYEATHPSLKEFAQKKAQVLTEAVISRWLVTCNSGGNDVLINDVLLPSNKWGHGSN